MKGDPGAAFRDDPSLRLIMEAAISRYRSLKGRGTIYLESEEERRAARGLMCKVSRDGRVRLDALDLALRASVFKCTLLEACESYLGRPLETRRAEQEREEAEWVEFYTRLRAHPNAPLSMVQRWLRYDQGYLRLAWGRDHDVAESSALLVLRALAALSRYRTVTYVPVLADRLSGDAHALDPVTPAGRMLDHALFRLNPAARVRYPLNAESREAVFSRVGLASDEVSSTVLVAGLAGDDPLLHTLRVQGTAVALPLRSLSDCGRATGWRGAAFAVENPSVFVGLCDWGEQLPPESRPTLVCTKGFFSLAARRLLTILVANGTTVYYSGDFDAAGLSIARDLPGLAEGGSRLWRMTVHDYAHALALRSAYRRRAPGRMNRLHRDFPELVEAVASGGAAYQESLLPLLKNDLAHHARSGAGPMIHD
ncbi:MAG TPA: TIGR02679 family protein [Longimicrobium sp.]|jgi:uncharacterized protein (TIGR02679 family)